MKYILILSLFSFFGVYSQEKIVNEYALSVNESSFLGLSSKKDIRFGIGTGVYHTFKKRKHINFRLGIEYNFFREFEDKIFTDKYSSIIDYEGFIHFIRIPLNMRLMLGDKVRFIFDLGTSLDIPIYSKFKAHYYSYSPYTNTSKGYWGGGEEVLGFPVIAFSGEIGFQFPFLKHTAIIKSGTNFGLCSFFYEGCSYNYLNITLGYQL